MEHSVDARDLAVLSRTVAGFTDERGAYDFFPYDDTIERPLRSAISGIDQARSRGELPPVSGAGRPRGWKLIAGSVVSKGH
jgi:hypothetical protein